MEILAQIDLLGVLLGLLPGLLVGSVIAYIILKVVTGARDKSLQEEIEIRVETAKKQAETIIKEARLDATSEMMKKREEFDTEVRDREKMLRQQEMEVSKSQNAVERQMDKFQQQERQIKNKERELDRQIQTHNDRNKELANVMVQQKNQLLKITSLDAEQAKDLLLTRLEDECGREMDQVIQRKVAQAEETAEQKAKDILYQAHYLFCIHNNM